MENLRDCNDKGIRDNEPKTLKAKVAFEIKAPCNCSEKEFREWLEFQLMLKPHISRENPINYDLDLSENLVGFVKIEIK